jgi:hypothetical protein
MIWFVIERYLHCLTGITHIDSDEINPRIQACKTFEPTNLSLNPIELNGLHSLVKFLENKQLQSDSSKFHASIPKQMVQTDLLLQSIKLVLENYSSPASTINTGAPFIHWPKPEKKYLKKMALQNSGPKKKQQKESSMCQDAQNSFDESQTDPNESEANRISEFLSFDTSFNNDGTDSINKTGKSGLAKPGKTESRKHVMRNLPRTKGSIKKRLRPQNVPRSNVERRRRVRCHKCEPCTRDDCGECKYCKDMKKFGGTGISKQCCLSKQCFQPLLPTTTTCMLCEILIDRSNQDVGNLMYECEICFEIFHNLCFKVFLFFNTFFVAKLKNQLAKIREKLLFISF